ncbi:unnamed protein product [Mycetohabitans rhizoxinica HKI 454]|uniref:Uncharacterized protein n=1 Tax=Mycetohabitans rhizoxinica (strain DSM 19002 / CIP 109453 / HKI 454) TaxID=882378 RepID=E5AM07_MYCRK|nr:unnamed protein product [Mycetohabitans rhizoxinica HKI 454]
MARMPRATTGRVASCRDGVVQFQLTGDEPVDGTAAGTAGSERHVNGFP